ncbi:RNA polymerase sigma factor SigB [Cutibacterium acnes JCM 18909]|nr:RNA polymerase sigma factor SigB [Cutibacterium acnes JCM 18909]
MDTKSQVRTTDGIDGKDAVGLYLDGIARTPLLNAAEEVALARRIEAGVFARAVLEGHAETTSDATTEELHQIAADGDEALAHFVRANLRLVVSVARKYGRSQMPLLDLVQEGNTAHTRRREIRLRQGIQVLDLRHLVGPSGYQPRHRAAGSHRPASGARR